MDKAESAHWEWLESIRRAASMFHPSMLQSRMTEKQLRQVLREQEKLTAAWKSGKDVQPAQVLQFMPSLWEAAHGVKLLSPPPDVPMQLLSLRSRPDDYQSFTDMVMMKFVALGGDVSKLSLVEVDQLVRNALYPPFIYMQASRLSPPNVFEIHDALFEKLLNTDVSRGLRASDVRLPFPGLYVRLPTGVLESNDPRTGWHPVSMIGFAEARPGNVERSVVGCGWGEPNDNSVDPSDDSVTTWAFPLASKGEEPLREPLEDFQENLLGGPARTASRFYGEEFDADASMPLMYRFVINFCLYLSSPNPDVSPTNRGQPTWKTVMNDDAQPRRTRVSLPKKKRRTSKGLAKRFKQVWDVGRNVKALERTYTASDVLTRGHFKMQAHGVGRALRKVIWIEPYISRRKTGRSAGHDYEVEN